MFEIDGIMLSTLPDYIKYKQLLTDYLNDYHVYLFSWGADLMEGKLPLFHKEYVLVPKDKDIEIVSNEFFKRNNIPKQEYLMGFKNCPINNRSVRKVKQEEYLDLDFKSMKNL